MKTVAIPARPLTLTLAEQVVAELAYADIYVAVTIGRTVQLQALAPLTTAQEVRATAAFRDVTDSPLAWQGVRP